MHAIHDSEASIYRNNHLLSLNFLKNLFRFQSSSCPERLATMSDDSVRSTRSSARKTGRINYAERDTSGTEWVQPPVSSCVFCCCIFTFTVPDSCEVRLFFFLYSTLPSSESNEFLHMVWLWWISAESRLFKICKLLQKKIKFLIFCLECFQESENFRDVTMDDDTLVDGSGTAADDSALFKTPAAPTRGTKRRQIDDLASAVSGVSISTGQVQFKIIWSALQGNCKWRLQSNTSSFKTQLQARKLTDMNKKIDRSRCNTDSTTDRKTGDKMMNWIVDWQTKSGNSSNNLNDFLGHF